MAKSDMKEPKDDMQAEYDFTGGVRGKYAERYADGSIVVVIAPDLVEMFPTSEAVNDALRDVAARRRRMVQAAGDGQEKV